MLSTGGFAVAHSRLCAFSMCSGIDPLPVDRRVWYGCVQMVLSCNLLNPFINLPEFISFKCKDWCESSSDCGYNWLLIQSLYSFIL